MPTHSEFVTHVIRRYDNCFPNRNNDNPHPDNMFATHKDDDDRMMRDMGVSEDDFGDEEELDADEDDEERTTEAGDEDQQYKSMQDSTALEAESPAATEELSSEAESSDWKMTPEFGSGMKTSEPAAVLEKRNRSGDHLHDVAAQEGTINSGEGTRTKQSEEEQAAGEAQKTVPAEEIHGSRQPADDTSDSTVKVQKA